MNTRDNEDWNHPTVAPRRNRRQLWSIVTATLATAIFAEAAFAGAMLSGVGWGHALHRATAGVLIASALLAGLIAMVRLRRVANGMRLASSLAALAVALCLQAALGGISAHGTNLMWLHVPLGVALVGIAMQCATRARTLGEETTSLAAARGYTSR